jgi:uncharacterized membrane protein
MRSHEERIAEVRRRIAEKERQKRRKQRRIVAITCIAACLAVIFGASFVMSGILPGISSGYKTAATILGGGAAPEYIIIGLLSFLLGVCVTILCFRVHLLDKEDQAEQRGDRANGIDH